MRKPINLGFGGIDGIRFLCAVYWIASFFGFYEVYTPFLDQQAEYTWNTSEEVLTA